MKDPIEPGDVELEIEDYGGDQSYTDREEARQAERQRDPHAYGDRTDGGSTGGTDFGTGAAEAADRGGDTEERQQAYNEGYEDTSANAGVGEFGEWDNSGVGTDLTETMRNTDVRSGMVKGGQPDGDPSAGPGQYGGDAGIS